MTTVCYFNPVKQKGYILGMDHVLNSAKRIQTDCENFNI